jgi:hypothetical protein
MDEINATIPVHNPPPQQNSEYQQTVIKSVVKVRGDIQTEIVYTYDKNGKLIDSVIRYHDLATI